MDIETLTDEECFRIVQKANSYAAELLLEKMDSQKPELKSEES